MTFPDSLRVIYEKNPLAEVICQLKFPRILRIDSELPAAFQENIRSEYPNFAQSAVLNLAQLPPDIARLVGLERAIGATSYEFASADGAWKVTLTSEFLALVTSKYRRWEDFKTHLQVPLQALATVYAPAFLSRIGLRYQDVVKRSVLGLHDVPWSELLQSQVLGELIEPWIEVDAIQAVRNLLLRVNEQDDRVQIQHGFATTGQDPEQCYLIDCDFFVEQQTEPRNATATLDRLNKESGKLFRWCIQDRLHAAMEPRNAE